ncbi:hypothetical protein POSPLADRAFT_1180294 [Postia placenta MAD-698-R-SB12]|uniref:Uncharacterized protein n=1 Tax=Postia placenta MAD-698-R-SB12 TaxID=670580 RepID=A0A1X6N402_9APHY|nr:hypothetical protein POSPLADRAFT_1180294 [Postia placenta MAD-698-R-SB12]OSX63334.1 hypothetical protein POSPLADRAFT_1180294 [Postia placenta MAD-698-R-SB12]
MESISVSHSETRIARLSPALVNSVYLWGARFSRNQLLLAQESVYLQRAVHNTGRLSFGLAKFEHREGLDVFGTALFALHAKAATLFERAARLMSQWTANPAYSERFATELFTLDGAIDRFIASLPPVHLHLDVDVARKLIITHTLARDATIKVQAAMKQVTGMPSDKDVVAAQAIAAMLDNTNIGGLYYVDPIVAIVWSDICRVLSGEAARLRLLWSSTSLLADQAGAGRELQHIEADHNRLGVALQKVLAAMTTLANTCPLTAVQAAKVQQEMENAAR